MYIKEIFMPKNIEDVKGYLEKYNNAKLIAGGTDLMIELKNENIDVKYLISLDKVKELKCIKEFNYHVIMGSTVTFNDISESKAINKYYGCLIDCSESMGSPQIRNAATIGGNIVNTAPAADIVPCLLTLGTVFIIESPRVKRLVKCDDYFNYYNLKKIKKDEILSQIILTKEKGFTGFYKLGKRNSLSISRLSSSVYIETDNDIVQRFRVALGAVGRFPFRLYDVEKMVCGKNVSFTVSKEVLYTIQDCVYESIRDRKSMPFKKEAVIGVYKQALKNAFERSGEYRTIVKEF